MVGMASRPPREVTRTPRSRVYGLLRAAYQYPAAESWRSPPAWAPALVAAAAALPYHLALAEPGAGAPIDLEEAQVAYSGLFDAGPGGAPCSLYGGHYESDRLRAMEETLRFYDFFGLRFERASGLFPDHITVQFEFMEYLARPPEGLERESLLRAQRDFLARRPGRWLPRLQRAIESRGAAGLYPDLVAATCAFVAADARHVEALLTSGGET